MTVSPTQFASSHHHGPDSLPENEWGSAKRLEFAASVIAAGEAASVLDVGCGTGTYLTVPLAHRFPATRFVGADADRGTLAFARERYPLPNLDFCEPEELIPDERFDVVIASEVLEHVEDPLAFLSSMRRYLKPTGRLVLTVPNGFGVFAIAEGVDALLVLTRAYGFLSDLKRRWSKRMAPDSPSAEPSSSGADTLAVSPHLNFFSYRELTSIVDDAGFSVRAYRGRTVVCGFLVGYLIRGPVATRWNADLADRLPPWLVSDWMFELEPSMAPRRATGYRRPALARMRRRMIARRWETWSAGARRRPEGDRMPAAP